MIIRPYQNAQFIKKNLLDRYVLGQSEATKSISMAVANHYLACEYNETCKAGEEIQSENALLIGPSGVGKSEVIRQLMKMSRQYSLPMVFESSSSFSPSPTWKGSMSIEQIVSHLFMVAGNIFYENHPDNTDVEFATAIITKMTESGIIVLDEADKIVKKDSDDCERSSSHDYQSSLLKLVEGTEVQTDSFTHERRVPVANSTTGQIEYETIEETLESSTINTEGIMWIFLGAFEGLDKITVQRIQREKNKSTTVQHDYYQCCRAGFIQDKPAIIKNEKPANNSTPAKTLIPNVDDLVEYGVKRELAGRLPIKVRFNPLKTNDLIRIMRDCPTSAYHEYQRRFELLGHKLVADTSALRYIAQKSIASKTNARALRQILNEILSPVMYQLSAESEPQTVRLTGKLLKSNQQPLITPQKNEQNRQNEIMKNAS